MKILNTMFTVSWLAAAALGTSVLAGAHSTKVGYTVGDKTFEAVVAMPQAAPKATVFIIHDWNGLDDYEIKRASMLADLGYRAVALDLFGTEAQLNGFEDYRRENPVHSMPIAQNFERVSRLGLRQVQKALKENFLPVIVLVGQQF